VLSDITICIKIFTLFSSVCGCCVGDAGCENCGCCKVCALDLVNEEKDDKMKGRNMT